MKQYDFAFSIGRACSCTESLRKAGLQYLSFPLDWVTTIGGEPDIQARAEIICEEFKDWFRLEDFVPKDNRMAGPGKDRYLNRRTDLVFNHDFPKGVPLAEAYPSVKAKYDRRVARFLNLLETSRRILIVCIDMPPQKHPTAIEDCQNVRARLSRKFPTAKFDFILFSREAGRSFADRIEERIDEGFTHISFDYKDYRIGKADHEIDLEATASILRERFNVHDYRTKREIDAFKRRTRQTKMREAGAENAWQYFLFRRRRDFLKISNIVSPRMILARLRTRRFDHVLSLGVNCEVAFRFYQRWKFVDSTPFSWGQTFDIDLLVRALRDLDAIGAGGFTWQESCMMWKCNLTGIHFHGRMKVTPNSLQADETALKADCDELASRLGHLKEKFRRILSSESTKALVYRINTSEACAEGVNGKLDSLQQALETLGARNHLLVVVAEATAKGRIISAHSRVVRYIRKFNPQSDVTNAKIGDAVGWNALFTEFAPAHVKRATHRFKFEK